jgi:hypothetical protein
VDLLRDAADQARSPLFRALLAVQVVVAGAFGVIPFLVPGFSAELTGFSGAEPFIYRLAGAASCGYAVAAGLALVQPRWHRMRIPTIATLAFNVGAVVAAVITLVEGGRQFIVFFILVAALGFALVSAYLLWRNVGPAPRASDPGVAPWFRLLLGAATAAALVFGLGPLLVPGVLASVGGFADTDHFVYRMAGAGTLGYAVAGLWEMRAVFRVEITLQVAAALAFNGLSAVAAALYFAAGGRSLVALLILVAATLFTALFGAWLLGGRNPSPAGARLR